MKILIVGPSSKVRGGITAVINSYRSTYLWEKWGCYWIETYSDLNACMKIVYFFKSLALFLFNISNSQLVHIHFSEPVSAMRKSIFLGIARLWKKPVVLHFHSFSPETTVNGRFRKLYQILFRKATVVIVLSDFWKQTVAQSTRSKSIIVLNNPCLNQNLSELAEKKNVILYAGGLIKRKGYLDLLKAFHTIAKDHKDWKVIFAGNGDIGSARNIAENLGIAEQVIFTGWISGEAKRRIFIEAKIFCLPSYAEGFPMAVLDAWSYGLPVITTSVGGLMDVLNNGVNALTFTPGDIDGLSGCLELLMDSEQLRSTISNESLKLASGQFSLESIVGQLDEVYQSVLVE